MTDDIARDDLPHPEPDATYTTDTGVLATAERYDQDEEDDVLYGVELQGSVGSGGAAVNRKRAVSWEQYTELDDEQRELVQANMDVVVKAPTEWGQYVMKHVQAFAESDRWQAGWLHEGAANRPDVDWRLEPFMSDNEDARMPKEIDDMYEKFDELDEELTYERIRAGDVYLNRDRASIFTEQNLDHRRGNATELKVGEMTAREITPGEIDVVPAEQAYDLDEETYRELEQEDGVWVQVDPDHTERFREYMDAIYKTYNDPNADAAKEAVAEAWDWTIGEETEQLTFDDFE